jgi:hypothetical protein
VPRKHKLKAVTAITTPLASQFQDLVDQGLIQPAAELPPRFSYPSVLVSVPSVGAATSVSGVLTAQGVLDGRLVSDPFRDQR